MRMQTGWWAAGILFLVAPGFTQTLTNQALTGKYYFRQVSLGTDATGNLTDSRSQLGTLTFDGSGHFSFTAQQVIGSSAATSQTGSGNYSVDPAGFVIMDSPVRPGDKENARFGPEALIGSSTESSDNTFDLFVAIPAPAAGAGTFSGGYWFAGLEFPGGTAANARNTLFNLNTGASGSLAAITVAGHAANLSNGAPLSQQVTGGTYTFNTDGAGTLGLGTASNAALLSGTKTIYVSKDGNIVLGGSTSHDFLIGVKAITGATNASWNGSGGQNFWGAGMRYNASESSPAIGFAAAMAANGQGSLTWTKRLKTLGNGTIDFTTVNTYTLKSDGAGTIPQALMQVAVGAQGNAFVSSSIDPNDPGAFEIDFGVKTAALSGTGVFLNPLGVVSAASFAPAGNPIAPGEFIALFGAGLAKSPQTATPPYPASLNGVTVLINGNPAPIYFVSTGQINCIVPYATVGPTATVVVQNGSSSNTVTVPVAPTAPGVFSMSNNGAGLAAVRHADFSLVTAQSPAVSGETVLVYLTGMGTVNPPIGDGTATGTSLTNAQPVVLVGGLQGVVSYSGIAPGFPGLYQINVALPAFRPTSAATLPLAISTGNAFHDQVTLPIPQQ